MRSTARTPSHILIKRTHFLLLLIESSHSTTNYLRRKMHLYILVVAFLVDVAQTGLVRQSAISNQIILSYKTDTHSRHETGIPGRAVQGSYSYIGGDGRWYKVTYIADEKGYRAKSEQLPWPLPVSSTLSPVDVQLSSQPTPVFQNVETVTVSTLIKNEDLSADVGKEEEQIKTLPAAAQITQKKESSVTVKDDNVLKEPAQRPVPSIIEPTEKLTIHVPLFTKVYSLKKATKSQNNKHRKTKAGSPSQIIRYKLSFLPAYGMVMH